MPSLDASLAVNLAQSLREWEQVATGIRLFNAMCEACEWEQAEGVRETTMMHMEATLDALHRAHKMIEVARP